MADRNSNNERRMRDTQNDWDWDYYYEYRYIPYSPYRRNDYFERNQTGRDMSNRDFSDRDFDRSFYGRDNFGNERDQNFGMDRYGTTRSGRFSGYGPRDYKRSDDRIEEDVNDRLTWHSQLDATDIAVAVDNGIVTLTGTVDSRQDKRLAEDVADSVPGVWDVNNQITVRNKGYYRGWRAGSGMTGMNRSQLHEGVEVLDTEGKHVGQVKEVRTNDFLVDRSMARDVFIPFTACDFSDGKLFLNIRADEIDRQGWEMPQPVESQKAQKNR